MIISVNLPVFPKNFKSVVHLARNFGFSSVHWQFEGCTCTCTWNQVQRTRDLVEVCHQIQTGIKPNPKHFFLRTYLILSTYFTSLLIASSILGFFWFYLAKQFDPLLQ